MSDDKASPKPWRWYRTDYGAAITGDDVLIENQHEHVAERIVRAVNHHDELVEILEDLAGITSNEYTYEDLVFSAKNLSRRARALLAKVKRDAG